MNWSNPKKNNNYIFISGLIKKKCRGKKKQKTTHSSDLSNLLLPLNVRALTQKLNRIHSVKWLTSLGPFRTKAHVKRCWNVTTHARSQTHSLTGTHTYLPVSGGHAALFAASDGLVWLSLAGQQATVSFFYLFSCSVWQAVFTAATTASAGYVDILIRGSHTLLGPVRLRWADVGLPSV